jgi:hypothetical protein
MGDFTLDISAIFTENGTMTMLLNPSAAYSVGTGPHEMTLLKGVD